MPSLFRFLVVVGILGGVVFGGLYAMQASGRQTIMGKPISPPPPLPPQPGMAIVLPPPAFETEIGSLIMMVAGFARLGTYIKYIPFPVTVGFTAGIAVRGRGGEKELPDPAAVGPRSVGE